MNNCKIQANLVLNPFDSYFTILLHLVAESVTPFLHTQVISPKLTGTKIYTGKYRIAGNVCVLTLRTHYVC